MRAFLLCPGDASWAETLALLRHDFYQLPEFVDFAARRHDRGQPRAVLAVDGRYRMLVPLIVRTLPEGLADPAGYAFDAVSPRGYAGPILGPDPESMDCETATRLVFAFRSAVRDAGILTVFSRLHPLLCPPLDALRSVGTVAEVGEAVSVDLALSPEEMWHLTRPTHRRSIHRARRAGYRVRIDEGWERFDDFVAVYAQSMARRDAAAFWRLPADYFRDLRAALGDRIKLCVVEIDDTVAAAALLTEEDGIAEYHSSGTGDPYVRASPTKLIIDFARGWAQARGNRVLDLTGSTRKGDSLIHFKLGFSPLLHPMYVWRVVADAGAYQRLNERASVDVDDTRPTGEADFFPAYRRHAPGG